MEEIKVGCMVRVINVPIYSGLIGKCYRLYNSERKIWTVDFSEIYEKISEYQRGGLWDCDETFDKPVGRRFYDSELEVIEMHDNKDFKLKGVS